MWVTMKGKHLTVKIDLERYVRGPNPFFLIFTVDEHLLVGARWEGEFEGANANVHGFFESLLTACYYFLQPEHPHVRKITKFDREDAKRYGFELKDEIVVYETTLVVEGTGIYYFCSTKDLARIYYDNDFLRFTDCPEYKGKQRGVVELPLREFVEDVLKVSREYLEEYAPLIAEIQREHGDTPENYDFLWELYREVEELYERGFNLETSVNGREK